MVSSENLSEELQGISLYEAFGFCYVFKIFRGQVKKTSLKKNKQPAIQSPLSWNTKYLPTSVHPLFLYKECSHYKIRMDACNRHPQKTKAEIDEKYVSLHEKVPLFFTDLLSTCPSGITGTVTSSEKPSLMPPIIVFCSLCPEHLRTLY